MNVKAVVKVMNFHALLRVEASGRQAVKYNTMEEELSAMMSILQNNQNLRLDKRIHLPDMSLPVLRIYLGSDLGFCGSVNTSVSAVLQHDPADTEKIVIGRKLRRPPNVHVYFTQEEFRNNFELLRGYLEQAVRALMIRALEFVQVAPDPASPGMFRALDPALDVREMGTLGELLTRFIKLNASF